MKLNENKKTIGFVAAAVVLVVLAFIFSPKKITPDAFLDQGEAFFPNFTDPNQATSMEVVTFDKETGSAHPFKVSFEEGRWVIPSHYDYPADAKDRLAQTAAGVIDIKRDDFRTDNVADYEQCGVVDPLDESVTTLSGRGKRVTLKGPNDVVLADFIIGNKVAGREGFRFVRLPDQKRVYAVRMNIDVSTDFGDWIDPDLLKLNKDDIDKIVLKDYSINERTMSVDLRDNLELTLNDKVWKANNMKKNEMVDTLMMKGLLAELDNLNIVDIRPKPEALAQSLAHPAEKVNLTMPDQMSLQNKGFFFTRQGQLYSNEGELQVYTKEGVVYFLRFGEVVSGSGMGLASTSGGGKSGPTENRYLFITADFNSKNAASDKDKENGQNIANEANARFANWFYVIPSSSFEKLHLSRHDLVIKTEA
jgi:hypothetical protein